MTHPWKRNYPSDGKDFSKITITIPRELRTWLEEMCGALKLPPWRLICIALDNERDQATPFDYPVDMPQTVFVEYAYTSESLKVRNFLARFKDGMGIDMLMLFRYQLGIPNRTTLLLAIRELLKYKLITETEDFHKKNYLEYPPGYKVLRVTNMPTANPRRIDSEKTKLARLEARIARQKKRVELMEGNYERASPEGQSRLKKILEQDKQEMNNGGPTRTKTPNSKTPSK